MSAIIRNIELDDYNKGLIELLSQIDKKEISKETFQRFVVASHLNNYQYVFVIEYWNDDIHRENDDVVIIGCGTLSIEPNLIHTFVGHIEDIVIHKDYRGLKYGKWIIEKLIEKAHEKGCYKVTLDCDEKCIGFYEKCGFARKGVEMAIYFS